MQRYIFDICYYGLPILIAIWFFNTLKRKFYHGKKLDMKFFLIMAAVTVLAYVVNSFFMYTLLFFLLQV